MIATLLLLAALAAGVVFIAYCLYGLAVCVLFTLAATAYAIARPIEAVATRLRRQPTVTAADVKRYQPRLNR